ncbi:MAG: UDP-N-acetylglucosamine 4,6-dehydratase (inverting) [Leptolyngbyaceae cyanobacterium]
MEISRESSILVTGGTGSFGKKFVSSVLKRFPDVRRLVVYSRDELKQFEMAQRFPPSLYPGLRYFLGDIRDERRLIRALEQVEVIVHAAALKQVPAAEYNPMEFIKTNVLGAENIIQAALDTGVKKVVALSTDKAAAPVNLYGATKLCSDKLFIAANNVKGWRELSFSVVRYGNVMGSRGSVIPFFLKKRHEGVLPITDPQMTRFNISLEEAVNMVFWAIEKSIGGEILVPRIPSYRITDVATAIAPHCEQMVVGIRPGEKIHEELVTDSDSFTTVDLGNYYAILPSHPDYDIHKYCDAMTASLVPNGFSYNSGSNQHFLTIKELRDLIRKHVDPTLDV